MNERPDVPALNILKPETIGRVALVWRGDPKAELPPPNETRHHLIFSALNYVGLITEPVVYSEEAEERVRVRLLAADGVLVWVDPLIAGKNRSRLDALLQEVAARGVWVPPIPTSF
jgi:hypothetical protein